MILKAQRQDVIEAYNNQIVTWGGSNLEAQRKRKNKNMEEIYRSGYDNSLIHGTLPKKSESSSATL